MLRKADFSANTERLLSTRTYPGSLQSCVVTTPASARLNLAYTYQNNGNISQMVDYTRTETLTYGYDELDRLLSVSGPYSKSYTYYPIGNIWTNSGTTYTYGDTNHKHAVTSLSTGESYTYDANGNMITRVENGQTYTQTFDIENRLSSVSVGGQTTQFFYDGDGNLVKKIKPDGSKTLYAGSIFEVDKTSGGSVTRTVSYYPLGGATLAPGASAGVRINISGGSNTLYYLLNDHLGSASVVTDASGTIIGEDRFYPYGETRFTTGSMNTDKLFTGQREMTGLGIYHYGARFYSPKLGRFLSPDTIVPNPINPQSLNRFSYVRNNPLLYIDPTGHMETCGSSYDECGSTPPCSTCKDGAGGSDEKEDGDDGVSGVEDGDEGSNIEDYLSDAAYFADNVGAIASYIELVIVDTMGALVIAAGCATVAACVPALGYALAIDVGVSLFSPLGLVENVAGGVALSFTAIADVINGTTYIHFNSEGGYDVGIGQDTVVSAVNATVGLAPEANYDAWISSQQLEYDNQRRSGTLPTTSIFEFHIPEPPNLWGTGWPSFLP